MNIAPNVLGALWTAYDYILDVYMIGWGWGSVKGKRKTRVVLYDYMSFTYTKVNF